MRSLIILNRLGDVEIGWEAEHDDAMREVIAKKMAEGMSFFQIEKRLFGTKRRKLESFDDLSERKINVNDDDIHTLFASKQVTLTERDKDDLDIVRRLRNPDEVVKSDSVAVPRLVGG